VASSLLSVDVCSSFGTFAAQFIVGGAIFDDIDNISCKINEYCNANEMSV
jgi:hypothetical protein